MEHITRFVDKVEQLEDARIKIPEELPIMMLNSLSAEYENFCVAMESREIVPAIDFLKVKLIEEEARCLDQNGSENHGLENSALTAKNKGSHKEMKYMKNYKFTGKCYKCNKVGHKSARANQNITREVMHKMLCMRAQYAGPQDAMQWCLDSSTTSHMCRDERKFNGLNTKSMMFIPFQNIRSNLKVLEM